MARINTNIPSVIAQSNLARSGLDLETRLERLSTGLRINRGKDDPAGLIISERIATDLSGISAAIRNSERAGSVIATTESALNEVNSLLNDIKGLMVEAANTGANSIEERNANQLQIDSAIDSITRIANSATFGGLKLIDGSLDYVLSGVNPDAIANSRVFSASFIGSETLSVNVDIIQSAQKASLFLNGDNPTGPDGILMSSMRIQIAGARGVRELSLASGQSLSEVVAAINNIASLTGIEAALIDPTDSAIGVVIRSTDYGSGEFVSVKRVGGPPPAADSFRVYKFDSDGDFPAFDATFPWAGVGTTLVAAERDSGRDVGALINGSLATGRGLYASVSSPTLSVELLINEAYATDPSIDETEFFITGGGALFQLGPDINALQQSFIGIQSVAAENLGGTLVDGSLQFLSSLKDGQGNSIRDSIAQGDFTAASDILDNAIDEVSKLRGRLGAFERNVLLTNTRSQQTAFENLTSSRSRIRDADFAAETSALTRAQILQQAGTSVLVLANQTAQSALSLLG
jgi:flagellin